MTDRSAAPTTPPDTRLRVLFVSAEIAPWVKTGGLGDVSAALPPALAAAGCDVRVLVPAYPALRGAFPQATPWLEVPGLALRLPPATLLDAGELENGARLILLDCPMRFERPGNPYVDGHGHGWPDNALRFGLLSRVAHWLSAARPQCGWQPDIVHCNDWHTGLVPAYRHFLGRGAPCLMTVHNLAFHGLFPASVLPDLGLPGHAFRYDAVEFHDQLSFLKAGLQFATRISTVSPTYAKEIQTEEFGAGLDPLLRYRANELSGILNGIDQAVWNPATDPALPARYSAATLEHKQRNKIALQQRMGLAAEPATPVIGMVGRMTHQKGCDLVLQAGARAIAMGFQFAILGSGDRRVEKAFSDLAHRHPQRCVVVVGYEEVLAHQIEAGADLFLMPSLFEPCGLNQMYSLRYGTPPVVRHTGGLADTVRPVSATPKPVEQETGNGFSFNEASAEAMLECLAQALDCFHQPALWRQIQRNGMAADFSWQQASQLYLTEYRRALAS